MDTILVQISDHHWTTQALHLACAMAHNTHSQLALLCLRAVRSPYLLGTEVGSIPPPKGDLEAIDAYRVIANGYGVEITLERMQYESLTDALIQAARIYPCVVHVRPYPQKQRSFLAQASIVESSPPTKNAKMPAIHAG